MISLSAGSATAEIRPDVGGRLGQLMVDGRRLLRGEDEAEGLGWAYWGSYPLLPWSNRIPGGRFTFEGRDYEVPINWKDGTAIHGLAASSPWNVASSDATSASLAIDIDTAPWHVRGEQRFVLHSTGLTHELAVVNTGDDPVPVGLGIHPWFRATEVRVPAASIWPAIDCLPTGPPRPVTADEDLRKKRIPPPLDACYTDLVDDSVHVGDIRMSWTGPVTQVVLYSEEPGWLCVEPVTMANDGFGLATRGTPGHGVLTLAPDTRAAVTYHLAW